MAIYSYLPRWDTDPLTAGALWSFNYLFYNKALKKVLFFAVVARRYVHKGVGLLTTNDAKFARQSGLIH